MSLRAIVSALGGDLYAGGRRANVPGPGHSAGDRSVSLLLDGDRVLVCSFSGGDWRAVRADLEARGLVDAQGRLRGSAGFASASVEPSARERRACACALWAAARPVAGTLAERHCRLRGVAGDLPAALRHHPEVPSAVYRAEGVRRPALLAAIRDANGDLCGVEVTCLAPNGQRARLRTPRKTIGLAPQGGAVRLDAAGARLLVAEGVFTALSARAWFGWPAWALLSTRNLRVWRPPAGVSEVLIAGDRGRDGEASARRLAARLRGLGLRVWVRWPPAGFGDWNDAAAAGALGEEGGRTGQGGR
jgi:hypothetical protein